MKTKAILSFAAVYVIWGSTYLAILYGIETIPPILLTAARFGVAALCMGVFAKFSREAALTSEERRIAWLSGALLIPANGLVCIVEQSLPSGLVAVVIGMTPIWMMMLSWAFFDGARPTAAKTAGALVGATGVGWIASGEGSGAAGVSITGFPFLLLACFLWTWGTLVQKRVRSLRSPFRFSFLQMLSGALVAGVWAFLRGDVAAFSWAEVSLRSGLAWIYLVVFGSLVAFSAYNWLSRNVEPHLVSTYALVNPVIAVALGVAFTGETVSLRFAAATAMILAGLYLIIKRRATAARTP